MPSNGREAGKDAFAGTICLPHAAFSSAAAASTRPAMFVFFQVFFEKVERRVETTYRPDLRHTASLR
jgi:hypothetical protein